MQNYMKFLPEDIEIYIYKIYQKEYLFPELIEITNNACKRRFDINKFKPLFTCKNTMEMIYGMYTAIHDMNLWDEVYDSTDLDKIDILYKISSHPNVDMYGHSGNSMFFCYRHIQYLKSNGWNSYVEIMNLLKDKVGYY